MKITKNITQEDFDIIIKKEVESKGLVVERIKNFGKNNDTIYKSEGYIIASYDTRKNVGVLLEPFIKIAKGLMNTEWLYMCPYNECEYNYDGDCVPDDTYSNYKCHAKRVTNK